MASGRTNVQLGNNSNLFDWTYIENAAQAHLLAADRLSPSHPKYSQVAGQAFFITNGEPLPYWDFPRGLWKVAGHTPTSVIAIPKFFAYIIGAISEFIGWLLGKPMLLNRFVVTIVTSTRYCNIDKARKALDYDPEIPLQEGMRRSVEVRLNSISKHSDLPDVSLHLVVAFDPKEVIVTTPPCGSWNPNVRSELRARSRSALDGTL